LNLINHVILVVHFAYTLLIKNRGKQEKQTVLNKTTKSLIMRTRTDK